MTLASILFPHWVSMDVQAHNSDKTFSQHLGLHHYCNTALSDKPCRTFPEEDIDCDPNDRYFCSMWRTTGFLMSFTTVVELATLVGFVVTIGGGSVKREYGWKVLCGLLAVISVTQFAAMGLVVGFLKQSLVVSTANRRPVVARETLTSCPLTHQQQQQQPGLCCHTVAVR